MFGDKVFAYDEFVPINIFVAISVIGTHVIMDVQYFDYLG